MKTGYCRRVIAMALVWCIALSNMPTVALSDGVDDPPAVQVVAEAQTEAPTAEPTATPTAEPTATPTAEPTATPTAAPTATPTAEPTATPTVEPTATPTVEPTATPTTEPTAEPTATPTAEPTATPTAEPTATPTVEPTATPTAEPTEAPTAEPTATPTAEPTATPTAEPTATPTAEPTATPTAEPTATPTVEPTATPTIEPTATPTVEPTATPTVEPTAALSEHAAAVQAMVNALPGVDALEAMDAETMANAYAQTDAAYEAYLALSAEEQALITGAQVFEPLFAAFNAQMMTLEEAKYSVNIPSAQGGTVTADSTSVSAGATVTLTVSPETGYGLYSLTITDASGTSAPTPGEGNTYTYTFTMPQSDVTINATFERVFEIQLYPKTYEFGDKILTATISGTDYTLTNKDKTSCMLPSGTYTITYNDPGAQYCEKIPDITLTVKDGAIEESSAVQKNKNYGYYTIKPEITRKTYTITGVDKLGGKVYCASTKALSDASLQRTAQFVDKVFLKVTTDKGFSLKEISATDSSGNSIKITPVKDNATSELRYYTVAMPADNVTISATFEVNASEETEVPFTVVGANESKTASAAPGTNFFQWINANLNKEPTTNCLWRVTYGGRTTVVDENTVIANGAKYTLVFECVSGGTLKIYAPCNSGEIDIKYNDIKLGTDDAQLTVTHIVDGESCTATFTKGNIEDNFVKFKNYLTVCGKYDAKLVWYSSRKKISPGSALALEQTEYMSYYSLTTGDMGALRFDVPDSCVGSWSKSSNTFNGGAKAGQVVPLNFSVKPDSVTLETASGASVTLNKVSDTEYWFTMPEDAVTINAQAVERFNVAIGETTNGSVTADVQSALAGATVTLTVSPEAGYVLDALTIIDANGETITPTKGEGNTYTFTMPDKDVTVQATFAATFTYLDGSKTETVPAEETPFLTWLANKAPSLAASKVHWHVLRDGGEEIVTEQTIIKQNDSFVLVWRISDVSSKVLEIYRACTGAEMPEASQYDAFRFSTGASVTVTHTVEGEEKTFIVKEDANEFKVLFAAQNIDLNCTWYFNGEKLSDTANMPLSPGAFVSEYEIGVSEKNCTVNPVNDSSLTEAKTGSTVSFTVTPVPGYNQKTLRVIDKDGKEVKLSKAEDGTYSFTMPACAVTITATFETVPTGSLSFTVIPGDGAEQQIAAIETTQTFVSWAGGQEGVPTASTYWRVRRSSGVMETVTDDTKIQDGDIYTRVAEVTNIGTIVYSPCMAEELPDIYRVKLFEVREGGRLSVTHSVDGKNVTFVLTGKQSIFDAFLANDLDPRLTWNANSGSINTDNDLPLNKTVFTSVPNSGMYPIIIECREGYGTVKVNGVTSGSFAAGTTMTVAITPAEGYRLQSLTVCSYDEYHLNEASISLSEQNTFTMPARQVKVTAQFVPADSTYTITIPASVSLNDASALTITASDVENLGDGEKISVQAVSANGGQNTLDPGKGWLVSGEQHIAYAFNASLDFDQSGTKDLALTIGEGETDGKPAGTYTDTLQFSVSLTTGE